MSGNYLIQLKPDAQPYAVYIHRRIPLPLIPKVKDEIYQLLSLGVIERVDVPTEWSAPIVVAPKCQAFNKTWIYNGSTTQ